MRRALVALLAAAAAFMAAGPAFASTPAHPKWRSSDPFGAWHNGGYIVYNNEWNSSHGPQTIWANSFKDWGASSTQAERNTAVETYPCVQKNFSNIPVRSVQADPQRIHRVHAVQQSRAWMLRRPRRLAEQLRYRGHDLGGQPRTAAQRKCHRPRDDLRAALRGLEGRQRLQLRPEPPGDQGVTHILASVNWLIDHHQIPANATLTQVNFGWEIASTGGHARSFTMEELLAAHQALAVLVTRSGCYWQACY